MNKFWNLLFILFVYGQTACNAQISKISSKSLSPDESVSRLWGDTVCNILFSPSKVKCYTLNSIEEALKNTPTIGGFVIDKSIGKVKNSYYPILQFLLQDSLNYKPEGSINKCRFLPYVAFEFTKKNKKAIVLLAFNCEEWGVFYDGKLYRSQYTCPHQLLRFVKGILPDDKYINVLTNKSNTNE